MKVKDLKNYLSQCDDEDLIYIYPETGKEDAWYKYKHETDDGQFFYIWIFGLKHVYPLTVIKKVLENLG